MQGIRSVISVDAAAEQRIDQFGYLAAASPRRGGLLA
jgi:hypothetical protein